MNKLKILIVDDEKPLRDTLARWFHPLYECITAPDAESALNIIKETKDLTLMISDVRMPPEGARSGVELVRRAKALNPSLVCILLTAYGTVDLAVDAMKTGADDFFQKPVTDLKQFELRVEKAIKTARLEKEVASLKSRLKTDLDHFTGKSPEMEKVYRLIRQAAPTDATVLIEGPSGTGKELVARALHDLSMRAKGPFVAVECASLPPTLLETELFGAVKGAFTGAYDRAGCFETADGGTIFLDEIGEISSDVQVKLLRVLETKTFQRVGESLERKSDFRVVAATNKNLLGLVNEGKFREDLYYRLNVIDIRTPALKDRPGDIALLATRFLNDLAEHSGVKAKSLSREAIHALEEYSWPGNVRQLRNIIEKMLVLSPGDVITIDDIPSEIKTAASQPQKAEKPCLPIADTVSSSNPVSLEDTKKAKILEAISASGGNKSKAAENLGISRRTLHRKLKEWGMS